jgi:CRISPR-associated exonuclease Cas4
LGDILWLLLALVLVGGAALVLILSSRLRRTSGLPDGDIVSSDVGVETKGKPLYSARYRLTGTPDYLVSTPGGLVPVEVKPARTEAEPHQSHLLQVLAYCLLVEETEGSRPPYGLLRYSSTTFRVDYNDATRAHLLEVMAAMRQSAQLEEWQVERSHEAPGRCRACGYRAVCDQSLWTADDK